MRDLAKLLYTHNPFYLLSAACVLFGLKTLFSEASTSNEIWQLAISLAGYTLLLAVTAIAIVRFGKVWEDARTVALLAVLMCLALSASFDLACNRQPSLARVVLIGGLLFSVTIIKLIEWGLPIRLPTVYRWPLFAMLGLFFAFPVAITAIQAGMPTMAWRVLAFPLLCGLLVLSLIPAIRRGSITVSDNGSPWPWPYYPWSIFFFILVGMVGRSYLLTISFQLDRGMQSTFALYYLAPIGFGVIMLLFEGAIKSKSKGTANALCVALLLVTFASSLRGFSPAAYTFHTEVTGLIGSPFWIAMLASLVVATYFAWRGASVGYYVAIVLLVLWIGVDQKTISLLDYRIHNPWPLLPLLAIQVWRVLRFKNAQQLIVAILLANMAAAVVWRTQFSSHELLLRLHLSFAVCALGCFALSDQLAMRLRILLGAIGFPMVLFISALTTISADARLLAISLAAATSLMAAAIAVISRLACWRVSLTTIVSGATPVLIARIVYQTQWLDGDRAGWSLLTGTICFLCGAFISATKAGLGSGLIKMAKHALIRAQSELLAALGPSKRSESLTNVDPLMVQQLDDRPSSDLL